MDNLQGIVFDFNGTLLIDHIYHVKAWSEISKELGGPEITMEDLARTYSGKTNLEILKLIKPRQSDAFYETYSQKKEAIYRKAISDDKVPLVSGAEDYFDFLQQHHVPFTIATASIRENVDFFIETYHLAKWIKPENIVYDDGTYHDKVAMYHHAGELLNTGDHILIYEDSLSGIRCAEQLKDARIIAMYSNSLKDIYPTIPTLLFTIHDFHEAMQKTASFFEK